MGDAFQMGPVTESDDWSNWLELILSSQMQSKIQEVSYACLRIGWR